MSSALAWFMGGAFVCLAVTMVYLHVVHDRATARVRNRDRVLRDRRPPTAW